MEDDRTGHRKNIHSLQLILSFQSCIEHEHPHLGGVDDQNLESVSDLAMVDEEREFTHFLYDL